MIVSRMVQQTRLKNTSMISTQDFLPFNTSPCLIVSTDGEQTAMDLGKLVALSPLLYSLVRSLGVPLSWLGCLEIFLPQFKLNTIRELSAIFTSGRTSLLTTKEDVDELNSLISTLGLLQIQAWFENVQYDMKGLGIKIYVDNVKDDIMESLSHDDSGEELSSSDPIKDEAHDDPQTLFYMVKAADILDDDNNNKPNQTFPTSSKKYVTVKNPTSLFAMDTSELGQPHQTQDSSNTRKKCDVSIKKLCLSTVLNSIHNHSGLRSSSCMKCSACVHNNSWGNCGTCKFCVDMAGPKKMRQKCARKKKCLTPRWPACPACRKLFTSS